MFDIIDVINNESAAVLNEAFSKQMNSTEIRNKFIEFFTKRGHTVIESASLITSDEKGITNPTLFNTAGMQPLIPYLLGKPYIVDGNEKTRLVDVQKCLRTIDIDDIGDKTHATFFEMLGNWSLGDYFKEDAIKWSYEFLTSKQEGLGLDPNRLYVTVFEGDSNASRDDEAVKIWKDVFGKDINNSVTDFMGDTMKGEIGRIFYMPADMNWWQAGENEPCGPDTEMYYDIGDANTGKSFFGGKGLIRDQFLAADATRQIVEVWNDVFMQYEKKDGKIIGKLPKPSVDTGAGLERLAMTLQGTDNIFDTDLFVSIMNEIKSGSTKWDLKSARIIGDHLRSATMLLADGVLPSNTDRGYVLRKLIRRAVRHSNTLGFDENEKISKLVQMIALNYRSVYPNVYRDVENIKSELLNEVNKFRETLKQG
ncbi:MAG: alanine--tRNA ligase-related protein, partial [Candidatus Taylorbacteria bacterium]